MPKKIRSLGIEDSLTYSTGIFFNVVHFFCVLKYTYTYSVHLQRKILQPTSRKNLTKNTIPRGIALLEEILVLMSHMKLVTLFIFTLDKWLFCYSRVVKNLSISSKFQHHSLFLVSLLAIAKISSVEIRLKN